MRNLLVSFLLLSCGVVLAHPGKKDTIPNPIYYSSYEKNLDSLMSIWYQDGSSSDSADMVDADTTVLFPEIPDSFYISRLRKIPSFIELTYNDIVKRYIQVYTVKKRDKLEEMLGLKDYYFPIFEQILDSYHLPLELKYLAVIESALNPRAVSRVGATGLWQFMYGTGRLYGLDVNTFVDERKDPIQATHSAARFLRDLYKIYNDWVLVIAAYNCGPGNVNRAIRRSGGKTNYWDIYYYLPKETRGYVPAFIAATYAINFYKDHYIIPRYTDVPQVADTIMINRNLHLQQVADVLGIPVQLLRDYNPQYKIDIVPGQWGALPLRMPSNYTTRFIEMEDSIYRYKSEQYALNNLRLGNPANYRGNMYMPAPPGKNMQRINYYVKTGDNLGGIAEKYHVSVSNLKYWNNINRNMIRAGQKLYIYIPRKAASKIESPESSDMTASTELTGEFINYQVKSGDSLWGIANQYPGVSGEDIMKWNKLSKGSKIMPGQIIKIKKTN